MTIPSHLYRFRSAAALLDGFNELENQQIYFCPPDQLNDPLEGFKDVFWQGDTIVWRNLLRHYLLCLLEATSISQVMGEEFKPAMCLPLVHQVESDLPQAPIRETYARLCSEFFAQPAPGRLIATLAAQTKAVRREGLIFYLRLIHPLAFHLVLQVFAQRALLASPPQGTIDEILRGTDQKLAEVIQAQAQLPEVSELMFSISEQMILQLNLVHDLSGSAATNTRGWTFIARDFPSFYVNALEQVMYPNWHAACFVANATNASMWGAYGDGHRGIALKFRARPNSEGLPTLDLYRITGWGGTKDRLTPHYAYAPHTFEKIRYTAGFPAIDFFESLGSTPRFKLDFWFTGPNGERSTTAARMLREDEAWRKEYWEKFSESFTTKTPEWAHEEEYRLTLHSMLDRFDEPESRKLKYRFSDLAGVVFGIKTATEDKLRIMQIVERKCLAENRRDFEFYQASYSHRTKSFELVPLNLLKIEPDVKAEGIAS